MTDSETETLFKAYGASELAQSTSVWIMAQYGIDSLESELARPDVEADQAARLQTATALRTEMDAMNVGPEVREFMRRAMEITRESERQLMEHTTRDVKADTLREVGRFMRDEARRMVVEARDEG